MSDEHSSDSDTAVSTTDEAAIGTTTSSTYKVLGSFSDSSGAGVRGENAANTGTPIGVEGTVPNNPSGYGLSTPNDARVGGSLTDASGNPHLTLNDGGPLAAGRTLDLGGNALADSGTTIWDAANGADVATDTASTFGESGVTVTHSDTTVTNGAIELSTINSSVTRSPDDSSAGFDSRKWGLEFEPQTDLSEITATISSNTGGESTVYLYDGNANKLTSEPSPGSGNSVTLTASLSQGMKYYVLIDAGGSIYSSGYDTDPSFPYTSSAVDITGGAYENNENSHSDPNAHAIKTLESTIGLSGTATVEFSRPSSVRHWRRGPSRTIRTARRSRCSSRPAATALPGQTGSPSLSARGGTWRRSPPATTSGSGSNSRATTPRTTPD
jgi:hypothetical protein